MRRALGLESAASAQAHSMPAARSGERYATDRPKSRFVQDGEVPIVMIRRDNGQHAAETHPATGRSPTIRLEAAEKALKTERHARETAERSLAEAQATIRDLQTKLGHAMLVREEARANAEIEKLALETALAAEQEVRQTLEQRLLDLMAAPRRATVTEAKSEARAPSQTAPVRKPATNTNRRGRSVKSESKPVKWWIKSK